MNAGLDTTIQICESELYDLNAALRNADAGGLFKDVNVTGALQNTVWDASKSGPGNFRIEYEIGDGISCPKDISQINLQVLKGISISKPSDITVCDLFVLPIISGKILRAMQPILQIHMERELNTIQAIPFTGVLAYLFLIP